MTLLVIGASNLDYTLNAHQSLRLGHSNPASMTLHAGGVGRNVAENLGRLGLPLTFITALTPGVWHDFIQNSLPQEVRLEAMTISTPSSYVELLDQHHDLFLGLAAMDALEQLEPKALSPMLVHLEKATELVLDLNFPAPMIDWLVAHHKGLLFVEGTSAAKVSKIKPHLAKVHTLKVNDKEAFELTQKKSPVEQASILMDKGVKHVTITLGSDGVYYQNHTQERAYLPIVSHPNIISTTGAGDAYFAGLVYAHLKGLDPHRFASKLAHSALSVASPVNTSLSIHTI